MTRDRAKAALIVAALVVLAVEGYLLYGYYGRHYGDASSGASVSAPGETTGRIAGFDAEKGPAASESAASGAGADEDGSFVHRATDANSRGDYTYIDDPRVNGDPDAVVLAEPSGPYERNIGVWYEPERQRWAIFNQDRAAVPAGSAFEVAVPPAKEGLIHRVEPLNVVGNATYLDHPLVNGEPDAELSVTQNWNPGGGRGVYNDHPLGVGYDEDAGEWFVYNADDALMPEGAAFNIAVSAARGPEG